MYSKSIKERFLKLKKMVRGRRGWRKRKINSSVIKNHMGTAAMYS